MKLLGGSLGAALFLFQINKQYADVRRADPGNPPRLTYGNRPDGAELFLGLQPQTGDGAIVHVLGDFPGFLPLEFRHLLFLPGQVSRVFQLNFHFLRHGLRKLRPLPVKGGDVLVAHLGAAQQVRKPRGIGHRGRIPGGEHFVQRLASLPAAVTEEVEIQVKYAGYLARQEKQVAEFRKEEARLLPPDMDYTSIQGLRLEARQKLQDIRPVSLGQAGRISGVSPADIAVLMIYLENN